MSRALFVTASAVAGAALVAHSVFAQPSPGTGHASDHRHHAATHGPRPTMSGQDAFAAIAEVLRILDADPQTDWSAVDLERLRQHLIDMNEVVLRAEVKQAPVPGGLAIDVIGAGRTERAILAMVVPHAAELDRMAAYSAKTEPIPGGVKFTVVSRTPADVRTVARLRGLGFAGLLAEGDHHALHHLAMARGGRN